jgi:hypothetical protein
MSNTGLKNEIGVGKILISGSLVINTKNDSGVYTFDKTKENSGIVFGKLTKPSYNEDELLKVVDTEIFELIPQDAPPEEDTVPRRIYNPVTQSVIDLTAENIELNKQIDDLRAKVTELEIVTESLRIDVDRESIASATAQNEAFQYGTRIQSNVVDLQNAIQKATLEAIQRVSLTARVASLEEQNRAYKEQIEGKDAKLAEGAKVGMDFSVKVITKGSETIPEDLAFRTRVKDDGRGTWLKGPDIEVYNFTEEAITISTEQEGETKGYLENISGFSLNGKERKTLKINTNTKAIDKIKGGSDKSFKGSIIFKSKSSTVTLSFVLQRQVGAKFKG